MKRKVARMLGGFLVALGVSSADTESLWVPALILVVGAVILWQGIKEF